MTCGRRRARRRSRTPSSARTAATSSAECVGPERCTCQEIRTHPASLWAPNSRRVLRRVGLRLLQVTCNNLKVGRQMHIPDGFIDGRDIAWQVARWRSPVSGSASKGLRDDGGQADPASPA